MMNIVMTTYRQPKMTREMLIVWWSKLAKHDFDVVRTAFDGWLDSAKFAPTPADILELCKPKVTIYARLPSPLNIAENKRHADELKETINKMTKPKTDMKAWAKKIIANPGNYPDISLRFAQEALHAQDLPL